MANLVIDIGGSCLFDLSNINTSGSTTPSSGVLVGRGVDLLNASTLCNAMVSYGTSQSGFIGVQFQESDTDVSGNYVPIQVASGTWNWLSGGRLVINSSGIGQSGVGIVSGDMAFSAFERRYRYVRSIVESGGLWDAPVNVGFVSQLKVTGSGGGFSYSPGSGTVNV